MLTFKYIVAAANLLIALMAAAVAIFSHKEKGVAEIFGVLVVYTLANMAAIICG